MGGKHQGAERGLALKFCAVQLLVRTYRNPTLVLPFPSLTSPAFDFLKFSLLPGQSSGVLGFRVYSIHFCIKHSIFQHF